MSGTETLAQINNVTDGTWSTSVGLSPNTGKTITIFAVDKAGRESTKVVSNIFRDEEGPSIFVTTDLSGLILDADLTNGLEISGTVNDGAGSGVDKVLYSIDGSAPSLQANVNTQGSWSIKVYGPTTTGNKTPKLPSQGIYALKLKAVDKFNNVTTPADRNIIYDTAKPTLGVKLNGTAVTSGEKKYIKNNSYAIAGTFEDTGTNVTVSVNMDCADATANARITQTPTTGKTGTWTLTQTQGGSTIADGTYTYTITATDEAGALTGSTSRKDTVTLTVVKDVTAPAVEITGIPDKDSTKISQFTFRGTAEDVTSGIKNVKVTVADKAAPDRKQVLTVSGKENWTAAVNYQNAGSVFYNNNAWDEGWKTITVEVEDNAGNKTTETEEFLFDRANPVLTVNESTHQQYMNQGGYTLTGSASDSYGLTKNAGNKQIVTIEESLDDVYIGSRPLELNSSGAWSVNLPLGVDNTENPVVPTSGTYSYTIKAEDLAGNIVDVGPYSTIVDITPPSITIVNPTEGQTNTSSLKETQASFSG